MTSPLGGSLTALLANADEILDSWIKHTQASRANTPELLAMLLLNMAGNDPHANHITLTTVVATAVQRLAAQSLDDNPDTDWQTPDDDSRS